jgi:hypothetical protein
VPLAAPTNTQTADPALTPRLEALETLTAAEADTLEAIVARLIPTDANGPVPKRRARQSTSTARSPGHCAAPARLMLRVLPPSMIIRLRRRACLSSSCPLATRTRC